jgi:hypothetical protein
VGDASGLWRECNSIVHNDSSFTGVELHSDLPRKSGFQKKIATKIFNNLLFLTHHKNELTKLPIATISPGL